MIVYAYYCFSMIYYAGDILCSYVFFFKQKTAYEMRISDWSSDVCSSDLWYCCYPISYRDLEEMLAERGISVDHTTIYRWVQCYEIGRASCRERVCQYV